MLDTRKKLFGTSHQRKIKRARPMVVARINDLDRCIEALSDGELRAQTGRFREPLDRREPACRPAARTFATVREASRRVFPMGHYDVLMASPAEPTCDRGADIPCTAEAGALAGIRDIAEEAH